MYSLTVHECKSIFSTSTPPPSPTLLLSVYNTASSPVTHWTHWYQPLPWPITSKNLQWRCAKDCRISLKSGRLGHPPIHITGSFSSPLVMLSWPSLSTFGLPFIKQNRAWDQVTVSSGQGYSWIWAALCMFMVKVLLNYEILPNVFWQIWPNLSRLDDINESPCLTDKVLAVSAALYFCYLFIFFFLPPLSFFHHFHAGANIYFISAEKCVPVLSDFFLHVSVKCSLVSLFLRLHQAFTFCWESSEIICLQSLQTLQVVTWSLTGENVRLHPTDILDLLCKGFSSQCKSSHFIYKTWAVQSTSFFAPL